MNAGRTDINFVWSMPLEKLEKASYGYRAELAGLIPVGSYKLTIVLNDGCGYVFLDDPNQSQLLVFNSGPIDVPKWYFGSCGIPIKPADK
jgi:hypothetical protein